MIAPNKIIYCTSSQIDSSKWNKCIEEADNGLIYAYSFYLDIMAIQWEALVLNDYEAVMPLTWNRKYGFYYLFQPFFVPTLGVFGKKITSVTVFDFLKAVPKKFRYWNIDLNEANCFKNNDDNFQLRIKQRANYHLNLNRPYEDITAGYKSLCRRKIKKAMQQQVMIDTKGKPADVVKFYRQYYESKHPKISSAIYDMLIASTTIFFERNMAKIYLAKLPGGEITAAYLVLVDTKFVYFLIGGSSEKGKQTGSFYLITDAAIKDHAGSGRIFRFEGSDMPGIAFFNAQFGADVSSYLHLNRNKLPFPVNLIKGR